MDVSNYSIKDNPFNNLPCTVVRMTLPEWQEFEDNLLRYCRRVIRIKQGDCMMTVEEVEALAERCREEWRAEGGVLYIKEYD